MNGTLNLSQYLYLKQQLVMFDAAMHQAAIVIDGVGLTRDIMVTGIQQALVQIFQDLTPPVALLELRPVNVNLGDIRNIVKNHLAKDPGVNQPNPEIYELVSAYPKLNQLAQELINTQSKSVPDREVVTDLIDQVGHLCDYIGSWVKSELDERQATLKDVLVAVNHIQVIDTIFEYTNETFGA